MAMHDEVKKWLKEQGYPLEMRVASLFRRYGFNVVQSTYVYDSNSEKFREIDVLANKSISSLCGNVEFTVVVECKAPQKGRPWLLFVADSEDPSLTPDLFWLNQYLTVPMDGEQPARILNLRELSKLDTFATPSKWSYGVTESLTSGNDRAYSAVSAVTSASMSLTEKAKSKTSHGYRIFEIIIPLIVVDAPLLEATLDKNEDIEIHDVSGGCVS